MKKLFILVFLLWGSFSFANSGEDYFNKGMDSYNNGNYTKAKELLKKSCDMGNAKGCLNLGLLYVNVQGVRQNYTKAKELLKKSCDMGNATACKGYSIINERGY